VHCIRWSPVTHTWNRGGLDSTGLQLGNKPRQQPQQSSAASQKSWRETNCLTAEDFEKRVPRIENCPSLFKQSRGNVALFCPQMLSMVTDVCGRETCECSYHMQGETKECWERVCQQAAIEEDPERPMSLIEELTNC